MSNKRKNIEEGLFKETMVMPNTVGQYTGLKDKNGVEIYEGDVVNLGWGDKHAGQIKVEWKDHAWSFASLVSVGKMETEIIGNIHDNPELL